MAMNRGARRRVPGLAEAVARYNGQISTGRLVGAVGVPGVRARAALQERRPAAHHP